MSNIWLKVYPMSILFMALKPYLLKYRPTVLRKYVCKKSTPVTLFFSTWLSAVIALETRIGNWESLVLEQTCQSAVSKFASQVSKFEHNMSEFESINYWHQTLWKFQVSSHVYNIVSQDLNEWFWYILYDALPITKWSDVQIM